MKRFTTALAIAGLVVVAAPAYGVDYTWNGSDDTLWNNDANWDVGGSYPDDEDDKAIINGLKWTEVDIDIPHVNVAVEIGALSMSSVSLKKAKLHVSDNDLTVVDTGTEGGFSVMTGAVEIEIASGMELDTKFMSLADSAVHLKVMGSNIASSILWYDTLTTSSGKIEYVGPLTVQEYDPE